MVWRQIWAFDGIVIENVWRKFLQFMRVYEDVWREIFVFIALFGMEFVMKVKLGKFLNIVFLFTLNFFSCRILIFRPHLSKIHVHKSTKYSILNNWDELYLLFPKEKPVFAIIICYLFRNTWIRLACFPLFIYCYYIQKRAHN